MEQHGLRRGRDLQRSLTLLHVFLLTSALICAGAGVVLGSVLSRSLKSEALNAEETALTHYVDGVVQEGRHPGLDQHALPGELRQAGGESRSARDRPSLPT